MRATGGKMVSGGRGEGEKQRGGSRWLFSRPWPSGHGMGFSRRQEGLACPDTLAVSPCTGLPPPGGGHPGPGCQRGVQVRLREQVS